MFRDSRGVVHTATAADPLDDLPAGAARALQEALLRPGDVGGALERCEAARELLERWQDAFFAALPEEVDLEEEARWAAEAGLSLAELEAAYDEAEEELDDQLGVLDDPDELELYDDAHPEDPELAAALAGLPVVDSTGGPVAGRLDPDDPRLLLGEELVQLLERELLLLPLRVRLEALVAAAALVGDWADLLADHEKLLGHLVLAHGAPQRATGHEQLADAHAAAHAGSGPRHGVAPGTGSGERTAGR